MRRLLAAAVLLAGVAGTSPAAMADWPWCLVYEERELVCPYKIIHINTAAIDLDDLNSQEPCGILKDICAGGGTR